MTDKKLKDLFEEKRHENLHEEFNIGQGAQALFTFTKELEQLLAYVKGPFAKKFKASHTNFDTSEVGLELRKKVALLSKTADEIQDYLDQYDTYRNPNSSYRDEDLARRARWKQWSSELDKDA